MRKIHNVRCSTDTKTTEVALVYQELPFAVYGEITKNSEIFGTFLPHFGIVLSLYPAIIRSLVASLPEGYRLKLPCRTH